MNRSSSLSSAKNPNHKKCHESEVPKTGKKKREEILKNRRVFEHNINTTSRSSSNLSSSSGSIEAPNGYLRFLLSHSSSSTTSISPKPTFNRSCSTARTANFASKTPKSAPISRPHHSKRFTFIKEKSFSKPITHKVDRVEKSQTSRKPISEIPPFWDSSNATPEIGSVPSKEELQSTPVASSKFSTCSTLDCRVAVTDNNKNVIADDDKPCASSGKTKTPPIMASLSPEIQSSTSVTTPACYGAGHLISGVTDGRKCKARGVLAVALPSDNERSSDNSNRLDPQEDYATQSSISILPSPVEASMHWLLSPCREGDEDDKENTSPLHGMMEARILPLPSSPLSDLQVSLDLCNLSSYTIDATNSCSNNSQRSTNNMFISPQLPRFQVRLESLCDYALHSSSSATPNSGVEMNCYNINGGNSPFSIDTLGSENVMQTPNSDSSLDRHVEMSCLNDNDNMRHYSHSEQLSLDGDLQKASLSPASRVSVWDTANSSFQFNHSYTPSNSREKDLSPVQKILDDHSLWTSSSTFENVSLSRMKISWKEGLASRDFDMDEFDTCRCLSDEEGDINIQSRDNAEVESKEKVHSHVLCSFVESISTDGDGLSRSEDSDWNLCYKSNAFEL